eukprot:Sspe_Gene.7139::Locus_2412_Transcript_1_1_Confidence_1.000_Length_779::g.7139::m.7139
MGFKKILHLIRRRSEDGTETAEVSKRAKADLLFGIFHTANPAKIRGGAKGRQAVQQDQAKHALAKKRAAPTPVQPETVRTDSPPPSTLRHRERVPALNGRD